MDGLQRSQARDGGNLSRHEVADRYRQTVAA
jgi:hypothetical protein